MQNPTRGQEPRHLSRRDIAAVAVGTVIDGIFEFLRRLHVAQQEVDSACEDSDSRGSETNPS